MKRLKLSHIKPSLSLAFDTLRQQRFFKDRLSWVILVPTLVLNAITMILLLVRLHPVDFVVPVHYSSLVGFDSLGPWYQTYTLGIFAICVTLVNTSLAVASFTRTRITSFFLLIGSFVVALFSLVISIAFASIV
ncbi:MAG TPA: hypothetical protein VLF41_00585 [Candidatus Nanoarchaeia archaeon]|nr:hypothetical protein [Candidatus Nanoarchaeia archaeon]